MNEKEFTRLKQAIDQKEPILVSGCLLGMMINYEEKGHLIEELRQLLFQGQAIAICPEVLGGLATPRNPSEIRESGGLKKLSTTKIWMLLKPFKRSETSP